MANLNNLEQDIENWDGKSAEQIKKLYRKYATQENFSSHLVKTLKLPQLQAGATWLLKAWLESGNQLAAKERNGLFKKLSSLETWDAQLHVLQMLPYLEIPSTKTNKSVLPALEDFVDQCLISEKKFVRAWAYQGLFEIARVEPSKRESIEKLFAQALENEPASVKARIRSLLKEGF